MYRVSRSLSVGTERDESPELPLVLKHATHDAKMFLTVLIYYTCLMVILDLVCYLFQLEREVNLIILQQTLVSGNNLICVFMGFSSNGKENENGH